MALDYSRLKDNERIVYDLLGEDNTVRIMVSAFRNACIRAEILGIDKKDPRFRFLQRLYRERVFDIFVNDTGILQNSGKCIFAEVSDDELIAVESTRKPEENSRLLDFLNSRVGLEK